MWWKKSTRAFSSGILFSASSGLISWLYRTAYVSCSSSKELHKNLPWRPLRRESKMNLWMTLNYCNNTKRKTMARPALRKSWRERFLPITPPFYRRVRHLNPIIIIITCKHLRLSMTIERSKRIDSVICWLALSETSKLKTLYSMRVRGTTIVTMRGCPIHLGQTP